MNKIIFLVLLCISCKPTTNMTTTEGLLSNKTSYCPEDGTCSVEFIENKSYTLNYDEFSKSYLDVENSSSFSTFIFNYTKNPIANTEDSSYNEYVYLKLDSKTIQTGTFKDEQLYDFSPIYGRLCFCRGSNGYIKINNGSLQISKLTDKTYKVLFSFSVSELTQTINTIEEIINLK